MPEDHIERRGFLRVEVHLDKLQVTVGVLGIEPTNAAVLNISRGGLKVSFEDPIPNLRFGYYCLVDFVETGGRINPEVMLGQLLRMEADGEYAIEFDSPLKKLNMGS